MLGLCSLCSEGISMWALILSLNLKARKEQHTVLVATLKGVLDLVHESRHIGFVIVCVRFGYE